MHKKINWGIIGLGNIASKFASDLQLSDTAILHGVASRSMDKAITFAEKHNAKKAYDSYEALVNDPEIDVIYIATPHVFHFENTMLCLQHNKAVLCEKPLGINSTQVQTMIEEARSRKVFLMEAIWTRFMPSIEKVLDLLQEKTIGDISSVHADFGFKGEFNVESRMYNKKLAGGSLLDIGIYPIFAALSILGIPENIKAKATFFGNGADAICNMIFEYKDAIAYLSSSLLEETPTEAIVTCENAVIKIQSRFHEPSSISIVKNGTEEILDFPCDTFGYNYEIEHFNQLLRDEKKESDIMTFDFSRNLIKTLDLVRNRINLNY